MDTDSDLPRVLELTNRQYDILLVDPRGTGWSHPITCGYTDESYLPSLGSFWNGERAIEKKGSDITIESLTSQIEYYDSHPFCPPGTEDLEYLAYVNTPNLARDLDLVRDLMGLKTLNFWGFAEGGSILGVTYAAMFPDHVGRIVLDETAHFPYWMGIEGNGLDYYYDKETNMPRVLGEFASQCAAAATMNPKFCPFASPSMKSPDIATDILNRINYIAGNMTLQSYQVPTDLQVDGTYTFSYFVTLLWVILWSTSEWKITAQRLFELETVIQQTNAQHSHRAFKRSGINTNNNLNFSSFNTDNVISGSENLFVYPAVFCLDSNFDNISTVDEFVKYMSKQIDENAIIGYTEQLAAMCLSWPNLTAYDVERYRSTSPPVLNSKLLVIGRLYHTTCSYSGALATYEYLGSDNANFLIHTGYGEDPNNCIDDAIKAYFTDGILPENGTVCLTDYTGSNNVFIRYFSNDDNSLKMKLRVGLGLGFGIPFFIGLMFFVWFACVYRRNLRRNASRLHLWPKRASGVDEDISLKDFKDRSSIVNKEPF